MNITILGAGSVGANLARRLVACGHEVEFGVRQPMDTAALRAELGGKATAQPLGESAKSADIVFVAVTASAAIDAVRHSGIRDGAILVDCNNPVLFVGGPILAPPAEGSTTAALAAAFPKLRVVKGFNHFGAEIHRDPALASGAAEAFFAADDKEAKAVVMELAKSLGFVPRDAGPLRNAAVLENLAVLWIQLAMQSGLGREFSFRCEGRA
jgi:predicted dinucleotide-binding enzyme